MSLLEKLRYKKYSIGELISMFTAETAMCSRRISLVDSAIKQGDRITVMAKESDDIIRNHCGVVVIKAAFFSSREAITNWLLANGFAEETVDGGKALVREWWIAVSQFQDSLALLDHVAKAVEEVAAGLPLLLYSSRARKIVLDHLAVMASDTPYPVCKLDDAGIECPVGGQGKLTFCLMQAAEGEWAVWLPGDDFAPLFPSRAMAVAAAKARQRLLAPTGDSIVMPFEPPAANMYRLVDKKKNLRDRIRWLRHESDRLERLLPVFDPQMGRAE
jgi:hypothetical protein